jgi:dienelactone hydrolase
MRRFLLLVLAVSAAFAQETFLIRNGQRVSGSEEFTITKTASSSEINGVIRMQQGDKTQSSKHKTVLNSDWTLASYHNETATPNGPVTLEAKAGENGITMRATWPGGGEREAGLPPAAKSFALENFVPSHLEAAMKANAGGGKFDAIVPSQLTHFEANVMKVGSGEGTLADKKLKLLKYTLTGGGPELQVWTDEASGDLMRMYVPSQDVEYVRDGFKLTSTDAAAVNEPPPAGVIEREVQFMSAGLKFPATLTLPEKAAHPPVIVFVHGSGTHDRDETIGPNKPFRDLAWGLAQYGIASLRYDKRAFLYPNKAGISLDSQVIADAAAALQFAATLDEIDNKHVFLLGHSLGASLAPYIVERVPARGIIMMASPARGLNEVIKDQIRLMLKAQGKSDEEIAKVVAEQERVGQAVLAGKATDADVRGMIPLPLFKDMLSRDPAGQLKKVNVPALVLQGGKDAQVSSSADFSILREIVANRPKSDAKLFPDLSHLFMAVQGQPGVYDAFKPGHVAPEVIDAIATWVKKIQ